MLDEKELVVRPIVQESVQHNARVSPNPNPKQNILRLPPHSRASVVHVS